MEGLIPFIVPDAPLPSGVKVLSTTREGGVSLPPYQGLNLAAHVGDDPAAVAHNRQILQPYLPGSPLWLAQCHSAQVKLWTSRDLSQEPLEPPAVDGSMTALPGVVLGILTADCLPLIFWNRDGTKIAAVHGGWKGVVGGILENTAALGGDDRDSWSVWIGPSISQNAYEVGPEVRDIFLKAYPAAEPCFDPNSRGRWYFDLPGAAQRILLNLGIGTVHLSGLCTATDHRFYSYRREGVTGRIATLVWIQKEDGISPPTP